MEGGGGGWNYLDALFQSMTFIRTIFTKLIISKILQSFPIPNFIRVDKEYRKYGANLLLNSLHSLMYVFLTENSNTLTT